MYINDAERVQKRSWDVPAESPTAFNGTSDMNFFNAQLDHSAAHYKRISPSMPDNLFNLNAPKSSFERVKKGMDDIYNKSEIIRKQWQEEIKNDGWKSFYLDKPTSLFN